VVKERESSIRLEQELGPSDVSSRRPGQGSGFFCCLGFFLVVVLGIKPGASAMLGKCSTTELHIFFLKRLVSGWRSDSSDRAPA
jgi:hypothetical protein